MNGPFRAPVPHIFFGENASLGLVNGFGSNRPSNASPISLCFLTRVPFWLVVDERVAEADRLTIRHTA